MHQNEGCVSSHLGKFTFQYNYDKVERRDWVRAFLKEIIGLSLEIME